MINEELQKERHDRIHAETKYLNLLFDLRRIIDGNEPACGFEEISKIKAVIESYQERIDILFNEIQSFEPDLTRQDFDEFIERRMKI